MITGRQIRAARSLLDWTAQDLATKSGLTRETVSRIEADTVQARDESLGKIVKIIDAYGVEFIENQGVRFKPSGIEVYEGLARFDEFYDFLYEHLSVYGGEVCLSIYDESVLAKNRSDPNKHRARMREVTERDPTITFRVLTSISNFTSFGYAQYRQPKNDLPSPTGFYAFGDCLALLSFADPASPYIIVIHSAPMAAAYKQNFYTLWDHSNIPPTSKGGA